MRFRQLKAICKMTRVSATRADQRQGQAGPAWTGTAALAGAGLP